jgi:inorganic pyrophosphatase
LAISKMKLSDIDPGPKCPDSVRMIVEIPKGSTNKYEYDVALGIFRLDRTLYSPIHYPGDYGFIPGTMAEDGDPIDVMSLVEEPSFPGCMIEVRPVGVLNMVDKAAIDVKIVAVPVRNPRYDQVRRIDEVPPHVLKEIEHFFSIYKELENKTVRIEGWQGLEVAHQTIAKSRDRYLSAR